MDKDPFHGFLPGFIIGAILGTAIGFLYAPFPGKDTRELVKKEASKMKSQTAILAEDVKKVAIKTADDVKEVAAEAKEKVHPKGE